MLQELTKSPQNILIITDANIDIDVMVDAVRKSVINCGRIDTLFFGPEDKEDFPDLQLNIEKNGPEDIKEVPEEAFELIKDADVLFIHFCPVSSKLLDAAEHLKLIMTNRGGVEHINVEAATAKNIPVVNCIRNADAVTEFVIAMMIDLTRDITLSHDLLHQGKWKRKYYNSSFQKTLGNSKVGLIGMGNIGVLLAKKLLALGVHVIAYDEFVSKEALDKKGLQDVEYTEDLDYLLGESDIVSLHLRYLKATENWFRIEHFRKMRKDAYFINSARGGLLNYDDLRTALKEGLIAGAALDVLDKEPMDPDDPLLKMENVLITSHLAGTTVDSIELSPYIVARDVDTIIRDDICDRVVNYRKLQGV
ncbi:MAG: hypothetical protein J5796_01835 [Erysipelotrichaceae bacterium]|nr:hypothetical protein [Erysipelotrichaceae bacterium]